MNVSTSKTSIHREMEIHTQAEALNPTDLGGFYLL